MRNATICLLAAALLIAAGPAGAQVTSVRLADNIVMPQSRVAAVRPGQRVQVTAVTVGVVILEQAATTTMDIALKNPTGSRQEAQLLVPVPDGAAISGFTFQGAGKEPSAVVLPKDEAIATYKSIVARIKDPALLEFAGYNLIRSSVFPVPARGTQKIRLTYEHLLPADGERVDYFLPRTEALDYSIPWEVSVKIRAKRPISTVYSPSHEMQIRRQGANVVSMKFGTKAMHEPGPLQISYLTQGGEGVTASLLAYPDPKTGGGYFLLLAGLPAENGRGEDGKEPAVKREVTVVIDRSGSMAGEKLLQAKAAAVQVIEGLYEGEAFNVIDYSDSISSFAAAPVVKTADSAAKARHYIRQLRSGGGTNIHDVLIEAVRQKPADGMLPIVLFLTDGLPTVGVRGEAAIREAVLKANTHKRRIFTFGVGYDVNAPLLDHLANNSRAVSTYVLPKEDVEVKVAQVYRRLSGPVLAEPKLAVVDGAGAVTTRRVKDLLPARLPDLFEGDRLVLLGRYTDGGPLRFRLAGDYRGKQRTFKFEFTLDKATTKNSFVPRLWASRKIAVLIDEIRQAGAAGTGPSVIAAKAKADPKMKELVDEIVRLSTEFGILTEYTAFLAREGSNLADRDWVLRNADSNLRMRAQRDRRGIGGMNQAMNMDFQQRQIAGNRRNEYLDRNMNRVQVSNVQQVNDRAFFRQGARWVDGNAINAKGGPKVDRTIRVGSPEFMKLLETLVRQNRQGTLSMSGEILLRVGDRNVLVK